MSVNTGFVNRLVGTCIVVTAAIIFIPNILDGQKSASFENFKPIPERPEFTKVDLKEDIEQRAQLAVQVKEQQVENIVADDAEQDITVASNKNLSGKKNNLEENTDKVTGDTSDKLVAETKKNMPVIKAEKRKEPKRKEESNLVTMAYVIQLGSFSHKSNVDALVKKLKGNDFKVFTRPVKTPNGTLTKVFVGPDLDKSKLNAKLPKLKKLTKLNGRLTQFNIAK
jgi:DedD protein